ncbi:MAG TPA: hypothetical protein VGE40_09605 [Bacilli bacterium]
MNMDIFLYLLFGFLDVIAILALIFKIFSFPFFKYAKEITIIGVTLSIVSYFNRFWLDLIPFDPAIQLFIMIIFFRYLIKLRLFESLSTVSIGSCSFIGIQVIVYLILLNTGVVTLNDAQSLTNLGTYIIQISTHLSCYLISFVLYRFNLGFSHIYSPPHDIHIRYRKTTLQKLTIFASVIGIIAVSCVLYWIFNYASGAYIILLSVLGSLIVLIYLSYLSDYTRETP